MARYIDADKIPYYLDTSEEAPMEGRKITFKSDVDKIPTADVVEVKHGYWIKGKRVGINVPQYLCSQCGKWEDTEFPYCNCGTKMDGGTK